MEADIINVYFTPKGIRRTLSCEYDGKNEIDISFELYHPEYGTDYKCINLNRREALCLFFKLLHALLPDSILIKRKK